MNEYQAASWLSWIVAILMTFHLAGCEDGPPRPNLWQAKAALAIAEAEQPRAAGRPVAAGSVHEEESLAGSSLEPLAKPRKPYKQEERSRRILYFGSSSCPACRVAEASLDHLIEAGWHVGPEPINHIQTVTIDATEKERTFARQLGVNSTPTWIVWENGRELERRTGPLDPFEIGRLFEE